MKAIEGRGMSRRYGGFWALKNVDIDVEEGEIRGLIGPNGAGKSTLMDVLSGRAPQTGSLHLHGEDITRYGPQRRRKAGLGRSFQRTSIFPDLTVIEQLRIAAHANNATNLDEVIVSLGLSDLLDMRAIDISYGDQRRLDLSLALVGRPRVLLLDEPAAGLSVNESLELAKLLKDLAHEWGVTVVLVEHDMEVVFSICNRISVLQLGSVLAEGSPEQVRGLPEVVTAYLGSAA